MTENFPNAPSKPNYVGAKQAVWECIGGCPRDKLNTNTEIAVCVGFTRTAVGGVCEELAQEGLLHVTKLPTRGCEIVRSLTGRGQKLAEHLPAMPCFSEGGGASESDRTAREARWLLPSQQTTLKAIRIVGGLTLSTTTSDAARRLGQRTGAVISVVDRLRDKRLVDIPYSKRPRRLYTTPKGQAIADSLPDAVLPESWKSVELPSVETFKPLIAKTYPEELHKAVARNLAGFLHEGLLVLDNENKLATGGVLNRHLSTSETYALLLRFDLGHLVAPRGWDKAARNYMAEQGIKDYRTYVTSLLDKVRQGRLNED